MSQTQFGAVTMVPVRLRYSPFPLRKGVHLRYCETFTLTTAGSVNTCAAYTYNLNSLFDPNQTGTGHQPYFYDTLQALYGNYQVMGVDVVVRTRPLPGVLNLWTGVQTYIDTNATDGASGKTIDNIRERAGAYIKPLLSSDNRENINIFKFSAKLHEVFGVPLVTYKGDPSEFGAVVTSNPSRRAYITAFMADSNAGASATTVCDIELVLHADMWGYIGPSTS